MASSDQDLMAAINFADACCKEWGRQGRISPDEGEAIATFYERWRDSLSESDAPCAHLPERPASQSTGSAAEELRYRRFLAREIEDHVAAGRLSLAAGHACFSDSKARARTLVLQIQAAASSDEDGFVEAEPVADSPPEKPKPSRNILEILLDPTNIQYLMMLGSALLVLGLVIWLIAEGIFENKLVIAIAIGAVNVAVLAGGAAMIRFSRYTTAGRGIALLACLVMPLNLWFYDAQGLIPLDEGGHLWIPALGCCVLYAMTALVVRDPTFVYALVAGVTLTGLLILGDQQVARFWEIAAPSSLLVVIGLLSIHVERAFPTSQGPFDRERFGRAFFRSGHLVLAAGLVLLLSGRVTGWLYGPLFESRGWFTAPSVATETSLKLLTLALVLASAYAYTYSGLVVCRSKTLAYPAVFTLLWAEVVIVDILPIPLVEETAILLLALTAMLANVALALIKGKDEEGDSTVLSSTLLNFSAVLALLLAGAPVAIGALLYVRATNEYFHDFWPHAIGGYYVIVMLVTAASCRLGAQFYKRKSLELSSLYFFGTAAALVLAALGALALLGWTTWDVTAPWLMLIPIAYVLAGSLFERSVAFSLRMAGHIATAFMLATVIGTVLNISLDLGAEPLSGEYANLLFALFFAEATLFYVLCAVLARESVAVYLAAATAFGAMWQLLQYAAVSHHVYLVTFALVGLAALAAYRLALGEKLGSSNVSLAAFRCGNAMLSIAGVGGVLLALNRIPSQQAGDLSTLMLLVELLAASLLAVALVANDSWRRTYVVLATFQAMAALLVFMVASDLTGWQKFELSLVASGLVLLVAGHIGWYREGTDREDLVSLGLTLGSLMAASPVAVGLFVKRVAFTDDVSLWAVSHEVGALALGLALLVSGFMCRIRATTLTGTALLVVYLATLVCFVSLPKELQNVAVYMMVGGATFFLVAILLSIYRDRLLALPEHIRRRRGVFRVLAWR